MAPNVGKCAICGCDLPNRYAVAGRCETEGCDALFCALHWRNGNRRCRSHGWQATVRAPDPPPPSSEAAEPSGAPNMTPDASESPNPAQPSAEPAKKLTAEAARRIMRETLERVRRLGAGAMALWRKLKKDRSPQAMLATLDEAAEANRARREVVAARCEQEYAAIVQRKKAYEQAPPARKRILEAELASLMARYKATERELNALLENERVLAQTRGRIHELIAYGMAGVTEVQLDDLIDEVEESVSAAEGRLDAARDLERAGRRKSRESEKESLWEELSGFEAADEPVASPQTEGGDAAESAPKENTDKPLRSNTASDHEPENGTAG